jgi:hypothetical protein
LLESQPEQALRVKGTNYRSFSAALLCFLCVFARDFENYWLAFRDKIPLAAWQFGEQRQFEPLHCRFNPPQMMATNGNLVRGEDELEILLVAATIEFSKDEMIVRQQQ